MRLKVGLISLTLLAFASMSLAANPPKSGTACVKAGLVQSYGGKKYTCIRSGKKLVWDKGFVIKVAAPTPTTSPKTIPITPEATAAPSASPTSKPISSLALDSRITPVNQLSSIDICQTTDKTPDYVSGAKPMLKQGFPRPEGALYGKTSARVLMIPLSFKDRPFTTAKPSTPLGLMSDFDLLKVLVKNGIDGYSRISGNRFALNVDILPADKWWNMDYPITIQGGWGLDNGQEITKIISENSPEIFAGNYDTYYFVTSQSAAFSTSAQAWFHQPVKNSPSGYANLALLSGSLSDNTNFMHELGHSLFGFEDLYAFGTPGWEIPGATFPGTWDLMAGNSTSFLNWDRFLIGWLKPSEVLCVANQLSTTHYLSTYDSSDNPKLLLINLTPGVTIAAEIRNEGNSPKVLVYAINSYVSHGNVPILAFDTLFGAGQSIDLFGWRINVLETDANGALIQVTKTDKDKFVIPQAPSQPSGNPNPIPNSSISVNKKDLVPTGLSTATLSLEVSGQQSYRVYATAPDDPQKVYFESGYIANNSKNIEVGITGLTCSKDSRVMVELSTFPDGKGETLVIELTLKAWKC